MNCDCHPDACLCGFTETFNASQERRRLAFEAIREVIAQLDVMQRVAERERLPDFIAADLNAMRHSLQEALDG